MISSSCSLLLVSSVKLLTSCSFVIIMMIVVTAEYFLQQQFVAAIPTPMSCPVNPGEDLEITASDPNGIDINNGDSPLTCNVRVIGITVPLLRISAGLNDELYSITIEDITCSANHNDVCVQINSNIEKFDTIHIKNVRSENYATPPAEESTVNFVYLVAFNGTSLEKGKSVLIEELNFLNATVRGQNSVQQLACGLLSINNAIANIENKFIVRNSNFSATYTHHNALHQLENQPVFGISLLGGLQNVDVELINLEMVYPSISLALNALDLSAIRFGVDVPFKDLSLLIKNVHFEAPQSKAASYYLSSSFLSLGTPNSIEQIRFIDIEGVKYSVDNEGSWSESYFMVDGTNGQIIDFTSLGGITIKNTEVNITVNSRGWASMGVYWGKSELKNLNHFVFDNLKWNLNISAATFVYNYELLTTGGYPTLFKTFNLTNSNINWRIYSRDPHPYGRFNFLPLTYSDALEPADFFLLNTNFDIRVDTPDSLKFIIDGRNMGSIPRLGKSVIDRVSFVVFLDQRRYTGTETETSVTLVKNRANNNMRIDEISLRNTFVNVTILVNNSNTLAVAVGVLDYRSVGTLLQVPGGGDTIDIYNVSVFCQSGSVGAPWLYDQADLQVDLSTLDPLLIPSTATRLPFNFGSFYFSVFDAQTIARKQHILIQDVQVETAMNAIRDSEVSVFSAATTTGPTDGLFLENIHVNVKRILASSADNVRSSLIYFRDEATNFPKPTTTALSSSSSAASFSNILASISVVSSSLVSQHQCNAEFHLVGLVTSGYDFANIDGILIENSFLHYSDTLSSGDDFLEIAVGLIVFAGQDSEIMLEDITNINLISNTLEVGDTKLHEVVTAISAIVFAFEVADLEIGPFESVSIIDTHLNLVGRFDRTLMDPEIDTSSEIVLFTDVNYENEVEGNTIAAKKVIVNSSSVNLCTKSAKLPQLLKGFSDGDSSACHFRAESSVSVHVLDLVMHTDVYESVEVIGNEISIDASRVRNSPNPSLLLRMDVTVFGTDMSIINQLARFDTNLQGHKEGNSKGMSSLQLSGNSISIQNSNQPSSSPSSSPATVIRKVTSASIVEFLGDQVEGNVVRTNPINIVVSNNSITNEHDLSCNIIESPSPTQQSDEFLAVWSSCSILSFKRVSPIVGTITLNHDNKIIVRESAGWNGVSMIAIYTTAGNFNDVLFDNRSTEDTGSNILNLSDGNVIDVDFGSNVYLIKEFHKEQFILKFYPRRDDVSFSDAFSPTPQVYFKQNLALQMKSMNLLEICRNFFDDALMLNSFARLILSDSDLKPKLSGCGAFTSVTDELTTSRTKTISVSPPPTRTRNITSSPSRSESHELTLSLQKNTRTISHEASSSLTHLVSSSTSITKSKTDFVPKKPRQKLSSIFSSQEGATASTIAIGAVAGAAYSTVARRSVALAQLGSCGGSVDDYTDAEDENDKQNEAHGSGENVATAAEIATRRREMLTYYLQDVITPLQRDANPSGLEIGSDLFSTYRSAIVFNIVIIFSFGLLHLAVALLYGWKRGKSIQSSLAYFHWPGGTNIALNVLFPASASAFATMVSFLHLRGEVPTFILRSNEDGGGGDLPLLIAGVLVTAVFPSVLYGYWTYLIVATQKLQHLDPVPSLDKIKPRQVNLMQVALLSEAESAHEDKRKKIAARNILNGRRASYAADGSKKSKKDKPFRIMLARWYGFWITPLQEWTETPWQQRTGPAWDMWSEGAYLSIDWLSALVVSMLSGFSVACTTSTCCNALSIASLVVCVVQIFFIVLWRPFFVRFDVMALSVAAGANLLAAVFIVVDLVTGPELDEILGEVTGAVLLAGFYGGLSSAVVSVVTLFGPMLYLKIKKMRAKYRKRKSVISLERENNNDTGSEILTNKDNNKNSHQQRRKSSSNEIHNNQNDELAEEMLVRKTFIVRNDDTDKNNKNGRKLKSRRQGTNDEINNKTSNGGSLGSHRFQFKQEHEIPDDEVLVDEMKKLNGKMKFVNLMEVDEERKKRRLAEVERSKSLETNNNNINTSSSRRQRPQQTPQSQSMRAPSAAAAAERRTPSKPSRSRSARSRYRDIENDALV